MSEWVSESVSGGVGESEQFPTGCMSEHASANRFGNRSLETPLCVCVCVCVCVSEHVLALSEQGQFMRLCTMKTIGETRHAHHGTLHAAPAQQCEGDTPLGWPSLQQHLWRDLAKLSHSCAWCHAARSMQCTLLLPQWYQYNGIDT